MSVNRIIFRVILIIIFISVVILLFSIVTNNNKTQVEGVSKNIPSTIMLAKHDKSQSKKEEKKYDGQDKILRFASIKSNEANARTGPGLNSLILWVFVAKNEPLAIIKESNEWRQVMDVSGGKGWIHSSILSPKRYVIVSGGVLQKLHIFNNEKSRILALIEPKVRCLLKSIGKDLCKVKCDHYTGWIKKDQLWGLLDNE